MKLRIQNISTYLSIYIKYDKIKTHFNSHSIQVNNTPNHYWDFSGSHPLIKPIDV